MLYIVTHLIDSIQGSVQDDNLGYPATHVLCIAQGRNTRLGEFTPVAAGSTGHEMQCKSAILKDNVNQMPVILGQRSLSCIHYC